MDDNTALTVLVVEDDPGHQLLVRNALTRPDSPFGVVQVAGNMDEATLFARQMAFDVLLVDNRIPGGRGLDLIGALKEEGIHAPFVLMTSAGNEELAVRAYRNDVADYVIKDTSFWRELPQILTRVVKFDRARKAEIALRESLERANERLEALATDMQLQNQQVIEAHAQIETRNQELEGVNRSLREAGQDLADFTVTVARTIEAPLNDLEKILDTLAEQDPLSKKAVGLVERARKATQSITGLVNRLDQLHQPKTAPPLANADEVFERVQKGMRKHANS